MKEKTKSKREIKESENILEEQINKELKIWDEAYINGHLLISTNNEWEDYEDDSDNEINNVKN